MTVSTVVAVLESNLPSCMLLALENTGPRGNHDDFDSFGGFGHDLRWRNSARVIAESLARVIAAIRITSVRWRSYLPLKTQNLVLVDPVFVALRFESRDWHSLV